MIKLDNDPLKVKSEVNKTIEMINIDRTLPKLNIQRGIVKKMIFLKLLLSSKKPSHYPMSLLYDSLSGLDSLLNHSPRYFYFNCRSLIENTLRTVLNLQDSDATGVNDLFKEVRTFYIHDVKITEIIVLLADKYTLSSNYVHSNISSNIEIHLYYKKVTEQNKSESELIDLLDFYLMILTKVSELFVRILTEEVEHVFHRKKNTLKYLVNIEKIQDI